MSFLLDKQMIGVILLLILVGVSGWFALMRQTPREEGTQKNTLPTLILNTVVVTQMNPEGRPQSRMVATEMDIFRSPKRIHALKPSFVVQNPNGNWSVQAEHGEMKGKGRDESLILWEAVTATHQNMKNQKKTTLETTELTFLPKQEVLKTDKPVLFRQGASHLQAQGLYAKLDAKEVHLLGKVRGRYAVR